MEMEITMLGTACAAAGMNRDNTSFLIENDNVFIMVDVSGNPMGKLKKLNVNSHQIKDIILTHFHIDHIYGLPSLLWGMWIEQRKQPLTIHCSSINTEKLKKWLELIDVENWPILFEININDYDWEKENKIIDRKGLSVSTFPAAHGEPNTGLNMIYGKKRIVYSSDTEPNDRIKDFEHINFLIHEATTAIESSKAHTSLKEIIEQYPINNIDNIILVHLTDSEPYDEMLNTLPIDQKQKFQIAKDFMKVQI